MSTLDVASGSEVEQACTKRGGCGSLVSPLIGRSGVEAESRASVVAAICRARNICRGSRSIPMQVDAMSDALKAWLTFISSCPFPHPTSRMLTRRGGSAQSGSIAALRRWAIAAPSSWTCDAISACRRSRLIMKLAILSCQRLSKSSLPNAGT